MTSTSYRERYTCLWSRARHDCEETKTRSASVSAIRQFFSCAASGTLYVHHHVQAISRLLNVRLVVTRPVTTTSTTAAVALIRLPWIAGGHAGEFSCKCMCACARVWVCTTKTRKTFVVPATHLHTHIYNKQYIYIYTRFSTVNWRNAPGISRHAFCRVSANGVLYLYIHFGNRKFFFSTITIAALGTTLANHPSKMRARPRKQSCYAGDSRKP